MAILLAWLVWSIGIEPPYQGGEPRESFAALADAKTFQELEESVGFLGVILRLRNGDWIAIRYVDHPPPTWSVAVVLDSQGQWFVSHRCFRERLQRYRHAKRMGQDLAGIEDLLAIKQAADLATARQLLLGLQFYPAHSSLLPSMTGTLEPASD
jgi:hypothetical protein